MPEGIFRSCGAFVRSICLYYRFLTSAAQPSIPSPLLPTDTSSFTCSIPGVLSHTYELLIPPAFALFSGESCVVLFLYIGKGLAYHGSHTPHIRASPPFSAKNNLG